MTFGQYLRGLRLRNGITIDTLAASAGISRTYLDQLEMDFMPPISGSVLDSLARGLGHDASELAARAVRHGVR